MGGSNNAGDLKNGPHGSNITRAQETNDAIIDFMDPIVVYRLGFDFQITGNGR